MKLSSLFALSVSVYEVDCDRDSTKRPSIVSETIDRRFVNCVRKKERAQSTSQTEQEPEKQSAAVSLTEQEKPKENALSQSTRFVKALKVTINLVNGTRKSERELAVFLVQFARLIVTLSALLLVQFTKRRSIVLCFLFVCEVDCAFLFSRTVYETAVDWESAFALTKL